jgi:hypothetical protein
MSLSASRNRRAGRDVFFYRHFFYRHLFYRYLFYRKVGIIPYTVRVIKKEAFPRGEMPPGSLGIMILRGSCRYVLRQL